MMLESRLSFVFLIIVIVPFLFLLPGTILGCVAAVRIRQSDGKLYGLRLAALTAMVFPCLLALIVPCILISFVLRIGHASSLGSNHVWLIGIPLAITTLVLEFKLIHTAYLKLVGKGSFHEAFRFRNIYLTLIFIGLLWIFTGIFTRI